MAQSDFNFNISVSSPVGGGQGMPYLNSNLSNPLASSYGTYCREYKIQASGVPYGYVMVWNGFVSSSNFIGIPNTKAQSLRILARTVETVQPPPGYCDVNVGVRTRTNSANYLSGYSLTLGRLKDYRYDLPISNTYLGVRSTYGLYLSLRKPNGDIDFSFPDVLIPGTYNPNTWYPIRMDVIPYGDIQDTINIYTGSMDVGGNITWSSILHTTNVLNGQSVYNPAVSGLYCGYTVLSENNGGYGDTSNPAKGYVDGLDIRVTNI